MSRCFDTLDDLDITGATSINDIYELVAGRAMAAPRLCGIVTTGPLCLSQTSSFWGRFPVSFTSHPEVWHVRSSPRGRIGQPLVAGEVRKISILIRQSAKSKEATVSNIKLWMLADSARIRACVEAEKTDTRIADRGKITYGAMGIAAHGINIFESRSDTNCNFSTKKNTRTVLSCIVTITNRDGGHMIKVESSLSARYLIAAALSGCNTNGLPSPRECYEECRSDIWDESVRCLGIRFHQLLSATPYKQDNYTGIGLVHTAEDIFEQMSFVGFLDQVADPFYEGALPNDMEKPCGLGLILSIVVRIACNPERWGLMAARSDDAYAIKEASLLIESIMPGVLVPGVTGVEGQETYSIDLVIHFALNKVRENILKLKDGQYEGKHHGLTYTRMDASMTSTLNYLFCAGVGVCVDLFGLRPKGKGNLYASTGFAAHLADPITESRTQSAYAAGLGNTLSRWDTIRTSTRGGRQLALARVMVNVDQWLKTGKYKGIVLSTATIAPESVHPDELDPVVIAAAATAAAAAAATATATDAKPATSTSASAAKTTTPSTEESTRIGGKKKKKRMETLLADRGKMRETEEKFCANAADRSLGEKCDTNTCGTAVMQAGGILGDVLQIGGCRAIGWLFQSTTSYLVSPTSNVRCAHCENTVNVVQSIAFTGMFGACSNCKHPRCMECVAMDIETSSSPHTNSPQLLECLYCYNCYND